MVSQVPPDFKATGGYQDPSGAWTSPVLSRKTGMQHSVDKDTEGLNVHVCKSP